MDIRKLNIIRRRKKYLEFYFNFPPKSKKGTKNKSEIQNLFIQKMKSLGLNSLKRDIAIQIISYTCDRNSPSIDKFAKNIIDIMHKPDLLKDKEDSKYLPFVDDNQIKYLQVKYILFNTEPSVSIKIRLFSSFISDLHFLGNDLEIDDQFDYIDTMNHYNEVEVNKNKYKKILSDKAITSMQNMNLESLQSYFGNTISITPHLIKIIYPAQTQTNKYLKSIFADWTKLFLNAKVRLKLPGIPIGVNGHDTTKEQKIEYKNEIKKLLYEYKNKYPILDNIQSPLIASIIYRPTKLINNKKKDIDNIMLEYIIPLVNEVFHPPSTMFGLKHYSKGQENIKIPLANDLDGLSIGYEILQIPATDSNIRGEMYFGFKIDNYDNCLLDIVDENIDSFLKEH